jgi:uncharacterized protein YcaQ
MRRVPPAALNSPSPPALKLSPSEARRFQRRALGLDAPFPDVAAALAHLGYIQIDPINVCGRMHDLILRNRVAGYREGDLMRHLHGGERPLPPDARTAFEHHLPEADILVAFPLEAWPHLQRSMQFRGKRNGAWSGRLTPREIVLAERLLAEIARRGPLASEDFQDDSRRARRVWGTATLVKSTLQKLFFHGRILIAQRPGNRRRYDLPERVLPARMLAQPAAAAADTERWLALLKLRQRRLATLKKKEFVVVSDAVQHIAVEGCPPMYCLKEDVALAEAVRAGRGSPLSAAEGKRPVLLAPLDPLIYDRRITAALWNFDYTWEAYTPAVKRVRGHYALPILAGTELVGHVDPKADRLARKLTIASRKVRRGHTVRETLREFAAFLGLRR